MRITNISEQKKHPGRYAIFIDNTYAFSLSEGALLESGITGRQEITEAELDKWRHYAADDKVYGMALRYAAMRARSFWEMETYLKRKVASPALTQRILNKLNNLNMLDDHLAAQAHVSMRRLLRPTSKRKLQQELRARHIDTEIIQQAIAENAADEKSALKELIQKKRRLPKYRGDNLKLMQYLARQGFDYEDIKSVIREDYE